MMKVAPPPLHLHSAMGPKTQTQVWQPRISTENAQKPTQEHLQLHQKLPGCLPWLLRQTG